MGVSPSKIKHVIRKTTSTERSTTTTQITTLQSTQDPLYQTTTTSLPNEQTRGMGKYIKYLVLRPLTIIFLLLILKCLKNLPNPNSKEISTFQIIRT